MAGQKGFTAREAEELRSYVYFLQDPRDDLIFYVGKGQGNRFLEHLTHIDDAEWHNKRGDKIQEIRAEGLDVRCFIARHGMDERTAFEVEAALIDVLRLLGNDEFTNKYRGRDSGTRGLWDFQGHIPNVWGAPAENYKTP